MRTKSSTLIIGASRGIGAATAIEFLKRESAVYGTHRGSGVPEGVVALEADITESDTVKAAIDEVVAREGALDTLVVSAGITRDAVLMRMTEESLREVMDTNAIGPMLAAKAALKPMLRARSGSIILVSSMSVKYGVPGQTNYVASKGALEAFARSLAREHAAHGIRVNVVAPGATETDMMDGVPDAERAAMIRQIPMQRLALPSEIAVVIADVASATYMTGSTVPVGGGL